jgi:hypothetical protein
LNRIRESPSPSPLSLLSFPLFLLGFALPVLLERGPKSEYFVVYFLRFGMGKEARILLWDSWFMSVIFLFHVLVLAVHCSSFLSLAVLVSIFWSRCF